MELSIRHSGVTEQAISALVMHFYAQVRQDLLLGPIFASAVADDDWDSHIAKVGAFWSSVLLRSGRYKGSPFQVHLQLEGLTQPHFERWLTLFNEACQNVLEPEPAEAVQERAKRIGESLVQGLFFRAVKACLTL